MSRTVAEWQGATDDAAIPARVKLRVLDRQDGCCAGPACGLTFSAKLRAEFDHIVPLILGGENRERNLQAICADCHRAKTNVDVRIKAKVASVRAKSLGLKAPSRRPLAGGRSSPFKRTVDGRVLRRDGGEA